MHENDATEKKSFVKLKVKHKKNKLKQILSPKWNILHIESDKF